MFKCYVVLCKVGELEAQTNIHIYIVVIVSSF